MTPKKLFKIQKQTSPQTCWVRIIRAAGTLSSLRRVALDGVEVTTLIISHQPRKSMGFPRQEYGGGLPFPPAEDLPIPGIAWVSCVSCIDKCILYNWATYKAPYMLRPYPKYQDWVWHGPLALCFWGSTSDASAVKLALGTSDTGSSVKENLQIPEQVHCRLHPWLHLALSGNLQEITLCTLLLLLTTFTWKHC